MAVTLLKNKGEEPGKRKPGAAHHRQESKQREQEQSVNCSDKNGVKDGGKNGVVRYIPTHILFATKWTSCVV